MPENLAQYSFLPWLRQGMTTKIVEADILGTEPTGAAYADERAALNVAVVVKDTKIADDSQEENSIFKTVKITGPGDITGINPQAILRTEPQANVSNFEANLLPYIEFYEEDFLWRFTPAKESDANSKRLRPWLTLMVLKEEEFTLFENQEGLSYISLEASALNTILCPPTETWAWAHVQLNKALVNTSGEPLRSEVSDELESDPDIGICRLLSPRKLQKNTGYTAFVIPAFETGRLAGLGLSISGIKAQSASWKLINGNIEIAEAAGFAPNTFPFYYHWKFSTGKYGDFESLVAVLTPVSVDPENGKIDMDIQSPGFNLNLLADSETIGFEGALRPPDFNSEDFPTKLGDEIFVEKLAEVLNLSVEAAEAKEDGTNKVADTESPFYAAKHIDDPIVVPPTYGYWHAMISKLDPKINDNWIQQLNLDPRFRGAAGLGVKTVQSEQEEWMHQAWQQIGQINDANQKIQEAELVKYTNKAIYKKHLTNVDDNKFAMLTGLMHPLILNSSKSATVNQTFKVSRIPQATKSIAFRKITRPEKKVIKKINGHFNNVNEKLHHSVIPDFNSTNGVQGNPIITAAKLKTSPPHTVSLDEVGSIVEEAKTNYQSTDIYMARDLFFSVLGKASSKGRLTKELNKQSSNYNSAVVSQVSNAIANINTYSKADGVQIQLETATYEGLFLSPNDGTETPSSKQYNNVTISRKLKLNEVARTGSATNLSEIQEHADAVNAFSAKLEGNNFIEPSLKDPVPDLAKLMADTRKSLDPKITLEKKILRNIKVWKDGVYQPIESLKSIMAYPEFPEPVYEHLQKISQDFILPNIEKLPANSVTLLETNQPFIEAYMAGLNHEMARELLWREYPTDQRGSYFRQFWDKTDNIFETDGHKKQDIKEMHLWEGELGDHPVEGAGEAQLVLVVRGDLFLKFPNTIVYAQQAVYDTDDATLPRKLPLEITPSNTLFPIFSAELKPDVFLFGFDLTAEVAEGQRATSDDISNLNPGWFFVFRERPGQVKFGLDDFADTQGNDDVMPTDDDKPEDWNGLSWEHLVDTKMELDNYILNFSKNITISNPPIDQYNPVWGNNAADLASILYQNPVIFARHAQEMLSAL